MANFSGNQYKVALGIRDQSGTDSEIGGSASVVDSIAEMRLTQINDIVWDGAFQTATIAKSGRRGYLNQDYISKYGTGTWTWDFDYLVDNQIIAQKLLSLIYPTGAGNTCATACTIPSDPAQADVQDGAVGAIDSCGDITIQAPTYTGATGIATEDRFMWNSILQNLTITCDMDTDGGRPHMTGQFMTGYKPTISDGGASIVAQVDDWDFSLFDCTSTTVAGVASTTVKSFSVTIDNPATRVGWKGTSGEADGYMRAGIIGVTGSATVKLTSGVADLLDQWITESAIGSPVSKSATAFLMALNASWSVSLPNTFITGYSQDQANDGIFVTINFIATGGDQASTANHAVIKMT